MHVIPLNRLHHLMDYNEIMSNKSLTSVNRGSYVKMLRIFTVAILFLAGVSSEEWIDIPALDDIFDQTQMILKKEGKDTLKLNDISENFKISFFGNVSEGEFKAVDGLLINIETIRRNGKVSVSTVSSNEKNLKVIFKFDQLNFHYTKYQLTFLKLKSDGGITIKRNLTVGTLYQNVKFENGLCSYKISASFDRFGKVDAEFTGTKLPEQLVPYVESWILYNFSSCQKQNLLKSILSAVNESLEKDEALCKSLFVKSIKESQKETKNKSQLTFFK